MLLLSPVVRVIRVFAELINEMNAGMKVAMKGRARGTAISGC